MLNGLFKKIIQLNYLKKDILKVISCGLSHTVTILTVRKVSLLFQLQQLIKNIACALNLFRIQIYGRPNPKALLRAKSPFVCKHLLFDTQICLMIYLMYNKAEVVVNTFCLAILKNTRKMVYNILLTFFRLVFCFATNLAK